MECVSKAGTCVSSQKTGFSLKVEIGCSGGGLKKAKKAYIPNELDQEYQINFI
jgi:hypothetical protein